MISVILIYNFMAFYFNNICFLNLSLIQNEHHYIYTFVHFTVLMCAFFTNGDPIILLKVFITLIILYNVDEEFDMLIFLSKLFSIK